MIIDGINIIDKLEKYKKDKIIILGHEYCDVDSIVSGYLLEKVLINEGYDALFCITDKVISEESTSICNKYSFNPYKYQRDFKDEENNKYFLVDHNERKLKGEIIGIIDHHPSNKQYNIDLYFNKPISSTTIYLCEGNEINFDKQDITLAIVAAMLDTASFHSTKGREIDKKWVLKYCDLYNIDYNEVYKTGLYFAPLEDLKKCSLNGLKKYKYGNKLVQSSYVHIDGDENNDSKIKEIVEILKDYLRNNKLDMFVFIVHDMSIIKTRIYKITSDKVEEKQYDRYTSRGNDIMPSIEKEISKGR